MANPANGFFHKRKYLIIPTNETPSQERKEHPIAANDNPQRPAATEESSIIHHNRFFWVDIILTLTIIICPWIFFTVVKHKGGVQFSRRASKWVLDYPKQSNFFFTAISTTLNSIIGTLFANAVTNLATKWIIYKAIDVFGLSFFTGLKHRSSPWQWNPHSGWLLVRRHLFWVMMFYMIVFHHISVSGISALITPGLFTKYGTLQGQEVDFGASSAECTAWFQNNTLPTDCGWKNYTNADFTTCLAGNQLLDVLVSGRNNMLSLQPNTSIIFTMAQLGVQLSGPIRGVLPNGPGSPFFNTVTSLFPFNASTGPDLTHNYTLQLQGLSSNVSCNYTSDTPIVYSSTSSDPLSWQTYNASCGAGQDFLNLTSYKVPHIADSRDNLFGFWACRESMNSYIVYLMGGGVGYSEWIGNISCTVSPIQLAVFPVEYIGRTGVFSAKQHTSTSAETTSELFNRSIWELGDVIQAAWGQQLHEFAESVLTFGVKSFGQPPNQKTQTYLRLFEAMIQGVIEYEATYIRFLYTASLNPPPKSCQRTFDGSVAYQVVGWFVNTENAYFLIPLTILNLTSLLMLVGAMIMGEKKVIVFDPTAQSHFIFRSGKYVRIDPNNTENWPLKIEYGPTVGGKDGLRLK